MQPTYHSIGNAASSVAPWLNNDAKLPISLVHTVCCSVDRRIAEHALLFLEGAVQSHIFLVTSGVICTYKLLADGRRQLCAFSYPGDVFGMECAARHFCTAEALSDSVVRSIPIGAVDKLIMSEPGFGQALLRIAAMKLASTREQMMSLGRKTATEKLATFLLHIAQRNVEPAHTVIQIDLPMKRCDIADYLGLTVETISRQFTRLKMSGVITLLTSNRIQIDDLPGLEALAEEDDTARLH